MPLLVLPTSSGLPCITQLLLVLTVLASATLVSTEDATKAVPEAGPRGLGAHRVILRFAGASAGVGVGTDAGSDIHRHVENLKQQPGILQAQSLPRLGMAVVGLDSQEASEQLIEDLQNDAFVELAVLDTWVKAFDFGAAGLGETNALQRMLRQAGPIPSECSAHPACRLRGLTGACCPVSDGTMLSCCSASGPDLVTLKTYFGTYLSEEENGTISQASGPIRSSSIFEIWANHDSTIFLKSRSGRYIVVNDDGMLFAQDEATASSDRMKFAVHSGENGTVALAAYTGYFLAAEPQGLVVANRQEASLWEQFNFLDQANQEQRFSDDPDVKELWGMHHYAGFDIDAPEAWKIWTGEIGKGITVAVIDTGIDYNHEDLKEQMWNNPLEIPDNGVDDDDNGYIDDIHGADFANDDGDPMDDQMHGTHCAGTIAGVGNNRFGVTGVAWRGVRLMALKFLDASGAGRTSDAIRAIDYAVAQGAKIASNSWGGGGSNSALRAAIEHAEAAGMLFTAASGNEGLNNDEVPSFPANYEIPNIISVASSTWEGELSDFSCFGNHTVHVAAPGSNIYSTVPGGGFATLSGTSMATPHVSGLAALVWMYRPMLSMHQVRQVIIGSVRKLAGLEGKLITDGLINAKNALESAWAFEPPRPPVHAPRGIAFEDDDPSIGACSGTVTIIAAADESDIEYYQVYFVSGAGFQLEALGGRIPATGEEELTLEVNTSFVPPRYAKTLMAVSGRASGEMPAEPNSSAPHVDLEDYGLPLTGPKSATWSGDIDLRKGFVQGSLHVARAISEVSITSYNVYWQSSSGIRAGLIGSIAGIGFQEPQCSGVSCALFNRSRTRDGGYRYEHLNYDSSEEATITVSGPGHVTITKFETEHYYDSLTIGETRLSGNITESLPYTLTLPNGIVSIRWVSDESINGAGWQLDLYQEGAAAQLEVETIQVQGPAFEIVPAYGRNELPGAAVFVNVTDYDTKMPPSPAFAPEAIFLAAMNESSGSLSGTVDVTPAEAMVAGAAEFYSLCLVDVTGRANDICWTTPVDEGNLSMLVTFDIPETPLPEGSLQLQARVGNHNGLGDGFASLDLSADSRGGDRRLGEEHLNRQGSRVGPDGDTVMGDDAELADFIEPQRHVAEGSEQVLWSTHPSTLLARAEALHGCVRSNLFISGLDKQIGSEPAFRAALRRALTAHLPGTKASSVQLLKVADVSGIDEGVPKNEQKDLMKVEIEVQAPNGAPAIVLDRVEARFILLSSGGRASSRFTVGLAAELRASGLHLAGTSGAWNVEFGAPHQLSYKMLVASVANYDAMGEVGGRQLQGEI